LGGWGGWSHQAKLKFRTPNSSFYTMPQKKKKKKPLRLAHIQMCLHNVVYISLINTNRFKSDNCNLWLSHGSNEVTNYQHFIIISSSHFWNLDMKKKHETSTINLTSLHFLVFILININIMSSLC